MTAGHGRAPRRALAALALITAAVSACGNVDDLSFPTPPPTTATSTPTTLGDLASVSQAPVAGGGLPRVALAPGRASLSGTVTGPNGAVGGATVHVERLVGDAVAAQDVTTQADGTWAMPGILGGRYRVRTWRAPDLALTVPAIFFLEDGTSQAVPLKVEQFSGASVEVAVDPDPPVVGQPTGLAVQLHVESVDAAGVVRGQAVAGAIVELANGLSWTVADPNPTQTGPTGRATWQVVCGAAGQQPLAVIVGEADVYPLTVRPCVAPPPDTTTTSTAVPATVPSGTASTISTLSAPASVP